MNDNENIPYPNAADLINSDEPLSENERLILSWIRNGKVKSITITFADEKIKALEIIQEKKVFKEARLYEYLQKNKYQN